MDIVTTLERAGLREARLGSQPNIIPQDFEPAVQVKIDFSAHAVQGGNVVRAGQCKSAPSIAIVPAAEVRTP